MTRPLVAVHTGDSPRTFARLRQVLDAAGADLDWDVITGEPAAAIRAAGVGLVVPTRWPGAGLPPAVKLRQELGIFAQHRLVRTLPGLPARHGPIDLLLVRETTEDVYAHLEHESVPGVFESLKVTTRAATERIARHAFETARAQGRSKVTVVHKSNIMKLSDGMFLRVCQEVGREFPDVVTDEVIVDALCMKLVLHPGRFDVLVSGNLYGDILSDLCAGLVGGASNAPAMNVGPGVTVFTSAHGDSPEVDGTDAANPMVMLLPALALLEHVGRGTVAAQLRAKLADTFTSGARPVAMGGSLSVGAFFERLA
jgi:isocitrate dehydrogenase (NAD+)